MKIEPHKYLENILGHWEDLCDMSYFGAVLHKAEPNTFIFDMPVDGPLLHAHTLRHHILSSEAEQLDYKKYMFGTTSEFSSKWCKHSTCFFHFPAFLFDWCRNSRRLYKLSEELTDLLSVTAVDDVKWSELRFPFTSFIIELEKGFTDKTGMVHHFFMVTLVQENEQKKFVITSIARKDDVYPLLPKEKLSEVRHLLMRKKWMRAYLTAKELNDYADNSSSMFTAPLWVSGDQDLTIGEMLEGMKGRMKTHEDSVAEFGAIDIAERITRIVVGFALYMRTLPSGSPHVSDWIPMKSPSKDPNAIKGEMFICAVTSSQKITPEEHADIKEYLAGTHKGHELRAHFREGHWRRPPGKGNDPTAEKTVWVRGCIVRRDRLEKDTLPVGAEQLV